VARIGAACHAERPSGTGPGWEMIMSDLQQRLNDLAARTDDLDKENEARKPAMQDVINKLSDAIRAVDQPLIRRHAKTLEAQVAAYSALVGRADKLVGELGGIDSDDRDARARLEALTKKASASQRKIAGNYTKLKELLDMAHDKAQDSKAAAAMAQWAEMESWMTTQREVARTRVKQMQALVELAESSIAGGDAKSLAQAQEKAKLRLTWKPTQLEIGDRYMKFCADCEAALGTNLQDQLKRDREKFKRMVTELAELNDQLDAYLAKLKNMKMPPPKAVKLDFRKAAAVLDVDEAKLKRAWDNADSPDDALNALAKEQKLKTTGKDMVAALRKARLLS
jgi:hypothetical protein